MKQGIQLIVYPVKDVAAAKSLFRAALGVEPYVDQPYYVGFRAGDQEIGLDPHGHSKGMTGPIAYVDVSDIRAQLASLVAAGGKERQGITAVGGGIQIAWLEDADGNVIGLRQNG